MVLVVFFSFSERGRIERRIVDDEGAAPLRKRNTSAAAIGFGTIYQILVRGNVAGILKQSQEKH